MLTEAEKKWLKEREVPLDAEDYDEDYHDAADFEVRVAHHATSGYPLIGCPTCKYRAHGCYKIRHKLSGHWCVLKHARLRVEQEMENER